jgi:predicted CxxxxCH...CXXCH cytochrome family protein
MRARLGVLIALAGCADPRPITDGARAPFTVHLPGILDPTDSNFHGQLVQELGWQLSVCAGCHGDDFAGGKSGASCLSCHKDGPTACTTCHGQPPATGAHQAHVTGGALARTFDCTECHVKPALYTDVGHLFRDDGSVIGEPTLTFGALAATSFAPVAAGGPHWEDASGTCFNVYCHGGQFIDHKATHRAPSWQGGSGEAVCGTCHGLPPSDHVRTRCAECHPKVVDDTGALVDKTRHVDGKISLGDESGTCTACHGQPPPTGAHVAHLTAEHGLRGPLACGDCHRVPAQVSSPGHFDSLGPNVLPAGIVSMAFAGSAQPSWDGLRCSDVYCHGGGGAFADDRSPTLHRQPLWTGGVDEIYCGACHGIPPVDDAHAGVSGFTSCNRCHPTTINPTGELIVVDGQSTHINGVVDVQP